MLQHLQQDITIRRKIGGRVSPGQLWMLGLLSQYNAEVFSAARSITRSCLLQSDVMDPGHHRSAEGERTSRHIPIRLQ